MCVLPDYCVLIWKILVLEERHAHKPDGGIKRLDHENGVLGSSVYTGEVKILDSCLLDSEVPRSRKYILIQFQLASFLERELSESHLFITANTVCYDPCDSINTLVPRPERDVDEDVWVNGGIFPLWGDDELGKLLGQFRRRP